MIIYIFLNIYFQKNDLNAIANIFCNVIGCSIRINNFIFFIYYTLFRNSRSEVFFKKAIQKISQNSHENICVGVSFLIKLQTGLQLYLKETPTQALFSEFCEIFTTSIFTEHLWWLLLPLFYKNNFIRARSWSLIKI